MQNTLARSKAWRVAAVIALTLVILPATAATALGLPNNNIVTAVPIPTPLPVSVYLDGSVSADGDAAVYSVNLAAGDTLFAGTSDFFGFDLYAFGPAPGVTDINSDMPSEWMPSVFGDLHYVAPTTGTYYLAVVAAPAAGGEPGVTGTASLVAGVQRKTTTSLLTTYEVAGGSRTTGASTLSGIGWNTYCSFEGTVTGPSGGVEFAPVSVLRQFPGLKQTKVGTVWTFGDVDAGYYSHVPFDAIKRKVTYTFQFSDTELGTATAEGLGFSYAQVSITPKALLTTPSSVSTTYRGRSFAVSGYLASRHPSGSYPVRLYCERRENGKWRLRKTVSAKASDAYYTNANLGLYDELATRYAGTVSLPYPGSWRIRASHSDSDHYPTSSGNRAVTVR